jgi:hypothetical protein
MKHIYIPYLLTYCMNKNNKILFGLIGMLTISLIMNQAQAGFPAMYEDQVIVCNINAVCKIINVDDYFSDEGVEVLGMELNADIDTFDMSELTK